MKPFVTVNATPESKPVLFVLSVEATLEDLRTRIDKLGKGIDYKFSISGTGIDKESEKELTLSYFLSESNKLVVDLDYIKKDKEPVLDVVITDELVARKQNDRVECSCNCRFDMIKNSLCR